MGVSGAKHLNLTRGRLNTLLNFLNPARLFLKNFLVPRPNFLNPLPTFLNPFLIPLPTPLSLLNGFNFFIIPPKNAATLDQKKMAAIAGLLTDDEQLDPILDIISIGRYAAMVDSYYIVLRKIYIKV